MQAFWEIVVSNALLVVVMALGVALLGRIWKNPLCLHVLWVLVLLKLVTPPVLTLPIALPQRPLPTADGPEANAPPLLVADARPAADSITAVDSDQSMAPDRPAAEIVPASPAEPRPLATFERIAWPAVLGWVWATGIVLFAAGHAYRILRFRRVLRAGVCAPDSVRAQAEEIAHRLGLRRVPEIRLLPARVSPLVWSLGGRRRPVQDPAGGEGGQTLCADRFVDG